MSGPTLVIMAAGVGSRYGGLKQIDPVGPSGEIIIDYSVYDGIRAGFTKVVFIIRRDIEEIFREKIGSKIEPHVDVHYAFQELENIPKPFALPEGRTKPWGTGHAVLAAAPMIDAPFAVINADDFYGETSFTLLADYLKTAKDREGKGDYCNVSYILWNTLSDHGHVARGVCAADSEGYLTEIHERTRVQKFGEESKYSEDGGETWVDVPRDSLVSMNMWGFTPRYVGELETRFPEFLKENIEVPKSEFYVPIVVGELIKENKATVKVLPTDEKWFGVTYREDAPLVKAAVNKLIEAGKYPEKLWK